MLKSWKLTNKNGDSWRFYHEQMEVKCFLTINQSDVLKVDNVTHGKDHLDGTIIGKLTGNLWLNHEKYMPGDGEDGFGMV